MKRPLRRTLGVTRPKLTAEQIQRAKQAHEDGVSWTDLGVRFGIDAKSVRRAVEALHQAKAQLSEVSRG